MILVAAIITLAVSSSDPSQASYDTQRAAMVAAAHAAIEVSEKYESGGAIYRGADGYHFTLPATEHKSGEVDYIANLPPHATLVALYHTHPGKKNATEFSSSDRALQKRIHLPMYVVVIETREVMAIGAESIQLGQAAVDYDAIYYNGIECRIVGEKDGYWMIDCGRLYYAPKSTSRVHHVYLDAT